MSEESSADSLREALSRLAQGEVVDWKGKRIPAVAVAEAIKLASTERRAATLTLLNACLVGDLSLAGIGGDGGLNLQFIGCTLNGFRGDGSRWALLRFAKCQLGQVSLFRGRFETDLVIEESRCQGRLELGASVIDGNLVLAGSQLSRGSHGIAIGLSDARIGLNLEGRGLRVEGVFVARGVRIGGDLRLDGAVLSDAGAEEPRALDLTRAVVSGHVRLSQGEHRRFAAVGRIHLDYAELGGLECKAASLDGQGQPALIADQSNVHGTVDLSGLADRGGESFEAKGCVRFVSARIGRQFQLVDARLEGDGEALLLAGAEIGADLLVGSPGRTTSFTGGLNADAVKVEGRVIFHAVGMVGESSTLSFRGARVTNEMFFYELDACAPLHFDNARADGLTFEVARISQDRPQVPQEGLPQHYAHPADTLLSLNFLRLESDLRLEDVALTGGNIRFIGAQIKGGVQFSRFSVTDVNGLALIGQSAELGGGLQIAGSPAHPALLAGDTIFLGTRFGGEVTFIHVRFGLEAQAAKLVLRSAEGRLGMTLRHCEIFGELHASAVQVAGDFHVESCRLVRPGAATCDLHGARVGGRIQLQTIADGVECFIDGHLSADSAQASILGWKGVRLADKAQLAFTNMNIAKEVDADELIADGRGYLDLSGTSAALLTDRIDLDSDSWGAGKLSLNLDNFSYARLARPSGRAADDAADVRRWRGAWLERRLDPSSARPARHLAAVLRGQGLFEASRRVLVDAFTAEGRARPTAGGRVMASWFGLSFGHGLSGTRALITLLLLWLYGTVTVVDLEQRDLLVAASETSSRPSISCGGMIDPFVYAGDAMIPLLDLGEERKCTIGAGPRAVPRSGLRIGRWVILGEIATQRFFWAVYCLIGWFCVSLAIATWSGLFRRGGRE